MWDRRSHLFHPLTEFTPPKVEIKWTDVEQKAFDDIMRTTDHKTLLSYPDFNKWFDIHTDARDYQLVAVISQEVKRISFCSRKLTRPQTRYMVTEKELLGIV